MKSLINKMLKISAFYLEKQKSFVPKKNCGMLLIETLKNKISDFLNSNTCFCSQLYGILKYLLRFICLYQHYVHTSTSTYLIEKHFALQFQETKEWFDRMKSERTSPSRLALTSQEERQRFFDETRERILQR